MMAGPDQRSLDARVRAQIYRHFVDTTHPPTAAEVAQALDATRDEVHGAFDRLGAARLLVLREGTREVSMAHPLSATPTPFRVEANGHTYYANCAWDSLGVAAMLDADARIEARCGDCDDPLAYEIRRGALRSDPLRIHFAVPPRRWWDDIGFT